MIYYIENEWQKEFLEGIFTVFFRGSMQSSFLTIEINETVS